MKRKMRTSESPLFRQNRRMPSLPIRSWHARATGAPPTALSRGAPASSSSERSVEQTIRAITYDAIALARRVLESLSVGDVDLAVRVADESRFLQHPGG